MYSVMLDAASVITSNTLKKFYVDPGCMSKRLTICATLFRQMSCYYSRNFYVEFEASLY